MDIKQSLIKVADGVYVEKDTLAIAEKIAEYDSSLKLKFCAEDAGVGDPPYKVVEMCKDGIERVVLKVWKLDNTVLERLYDADMQRHNLLAAIDGHNLSVESDRNRRYREEMDEAADIMAHYLGSSKGRYSFVDPKTEKKITLDDQEGIPAKVEHS